MNQVFVALPEFLSSWGLTLKWVWPLHSVCLSAYQNGVSSFDATSQRITALPMNRKCATLFKSLPSRAQTNKTNIDCAKPPFQPAASFKLALLFLDESPNNSPLLNEFHACCYLQSHSSGLSIGALEMPHPNMLKVKESLFFSPYQKKTLKKKKNWAANDADLVGDMNQSEKVILIESDQGNRKHYTPGK